eukprot:gene8184-16827_t
MKGLNMEDSKKLIANTFKNHTHNILIWGGFFSSSLLVYFLLSSGDFSFLLTYASFMRCFAFGVLNFKMWSGMSGKGVSLKTLQLYAIVFIVRLLSIMRHQGYLPFDKTGDWFYHAVEWLSLAAVCLAIFGMLSPLKYSYDAKYDLFGNLHIPDYLGALYLLIPCALIAALFHPALNHEWLSDTCWTMSMYLESVAMLPQLYMFQKQAVVEGGTVEALLGHTVFALGFSRFFEIVFWCASFRELTDHLGNRTSGYLVLFAQIAHVAIMGDFFFYYGKSVSQGVPMELPQSYSAHV